METKVPNDQLLELVKFSQATAIDLVAEINRRTIDNSLYYLFSDITASYILAYSYLATYLQGKKPSEPSKWNEIKEAAHESLDIAFRSIEKNMPIYEEKLKSHVNH